MVIFRWPSWRDEKNILKEFSEIDNGSYGNGNVLRFLALRLLFRTSSLGNRLVNLQTMGDHLSLLF